MTRRSARVLAFCIAGAAVAMATGCGDDSKPESPSRDARATAQEWVDARNAGDTTKVCELYVPEVRERIDKVFGDCASHYETKPVPPSGFQLKNFRQEGDRASVEIQTESGENTTSYPVSLRRVGGEWSIGVTGP